MNLCVLTVPGPVPSQSLKATPSEEIISLSWKEPTEPNGVIIQYEVLSLAAVVEAKLNTAILWKNVKNKKWFLCLFSNSDQLQWRAFV